MEGPLFYFHKIVIYLYHQQLDDDYDLDNDYEMDGQTYEKRERISLFQIGQYVT
ncbi:hypothetical protein J2Z66_000010 [Paenibacillus eucommiae]|uniref:Uncharacterized protein n=1 Tax=Paenibacillus eucommiae TaxID=1355755 RepID=A0ABS4ILL8_9BACL|nr:hypothetical protein [Paenibacillus eucommiae]